MYLKKTKGSLVENKNITSMKKLCILNIGLIILCILSCIIGPSVLELFKKGGFDPTIPTDITTIIMTISTISISMFQIIIEKVNDRILGMSYKKIFFKDSIWKYRNFPNSAIILLEMLVFSNILNLFKQKLHINILHFIVLLITIYFSCWTFYLSLIVVTKKSKIYYKIKKKIINNRDNIIPDIIEKLPLLEKEEKIDKYHNSYIYEEIGILIHLILAIENNKNLKEQVDNKNLKERVINIINNIIIWDDRKPEHLIPNIECKGNKEFGKNKTWEDILKQIKDKFEYKAS